jgi:hypothetical protein
MLLIAILIALGPDGTAKEPSYKVKVHKDVDSVVAQKEKDRTVFVITSKSGIGGADIALDKGAWPEKVAFRFMYRKGNAFDTLEDIRLYTDRVLIQGAQKFSGKMPFRFVGADRPLDAIEPGGDEAAGYLDVRVHPGDGGLDLILPANMLRGSDKLRITWIDAYRR